MSEVTRLELRRFINNLAKIKPDIEQLEFFAHTRPGALLALENSLPAPEHKDLFDQVLHTTQEEVKNPQIDNLKNAFSVIERLIQTTQNPPPSLLDHSIVQEQLAITREIINYYTKLYRDTKLVLSSARFKARQKPNFKDIPVPEKLHLTENSMQPLPSNVKRLDVHRAREYLATFIQATDQLETSTINLEDLFEETISEEHIALFPELSILTQSAIAERNNMIEAARILQGSIQQRIDELTQEPLPNPSAQISKSES